MPSLRTLLRTSPLSALSGRFATDPRRLERIVRSKWLLWRNFPRPRRNRLSSPLYVTLTSFPARFRTLATTLKCLMMQSCAPTGVVLWIAAADVPKLPREVLQLRRFGLQIRGCRDLRSYKKIIPGLQEQPEAFWATADDDCYYDPNWLEQLVRAWNPYSREVLCHRAHRMRLDDRGLPLTYLAWDLELSTDSAHPLNFMTGVGGVLYPPDCFAPEVTDEALFQQLCPQCDDVWLWWMLRRKGYWVRKVGGAWSPLYWRDSQSQSLYHANVLENGNDVAIRNLTAHFGFPGRQMVGASA